MRAVLPPHELKLLWSDITKAHGTFQGVVEVRTESLSDGAACIALIRFASGIEAFLVSFTGDGRIRGFFTNAAALVGRRFVEHLAHGEFEVASHPFDSAMRSAASPNQLADLWKATQGQLGDFQAIERVSVKGERGALDAFVVGRFAHETRTLEVVVNHQAQIVGFFVLPAQTAWTSPSYSDPAKYTERAIHVGSSPPLPGHLTLPNGAGPFPLVILVHGSGPGDEDESGGDSNKPFKDLAQGLATRGVALLRYDKRTHVPPLPPPPITVREEYFASVADALSLARGLASIDKSRIVLAGHSMGGYLAPWLARNNPGLAGIAMLAAPARPMLTLAVEQTEQLAKLHPDRKDLVAQLAQERRDQERASASDLKTDEPIFNATGAYWLLLRDYSPVATAASVPISMFVAQGGHDYNVSSTADYSLWHDGLEKHPNVVFKLYPDLNHLFISWGGTPSVEDNKHHGHVAQILVDDLAAWVNVTVAR